MILIPRRLPVNRCQQKVRNAFYRTQLSSAAKYERRLQLQERQSKANSFNCDSPPGKRQMSVRTGIMPFQNAHNIGFHVSPICLGDVFENIRETKSNNVSPNTTTMFHQKTSVQTVAVVFEATRYIIKLYHHRQHKKYTVRGSIKEVV